MNISSSLLFLPALCLLLSCSTTEEIPVRGKLPELTTTASRYQTDDELRKQLAAVKESLRKRPDDSALLLRQASLQVELELTGDAITTLERLKNMGYQGEPKIYGTLGMLYFKKEEYQQARDNYLIFRNLSADNTSTTAKIDDQIDLIEFRLNLLERPYDITLSPLDSTINTPDAEYLSQFTMDGKKIIFTRRDNRQEDLYIAESTSNGYQVRPLEEVNTPMNEGAHTISADGKLLIFTHCNERFGYGGCDLYSSELQADNTWSTPSNLGSNINTRHWESQPSLSADGNLLFYCTTQPLQNRGASDIYVSRRKADGTWSAPRNVGDQINTNSGEESPYFHPDGQTLYFRSNGHASLGGYDLYVTSRIEGGWTTPLNLGSPINTSGNDGALVVSLDGRSGYYASDYYQGEAQNDLDIYQFELPEPFRPEAMTYVKGRVTNRESKLPLLAKIHVDNLEGLPIKSSFTTNSNGEFLAAVPVGKKALLNIESENHVFYSDHVSYDESRLGSDPYILDIKLEPIVSSSPESKSAPVILENIFFASGSAQLLETSLPEIDYLANLLLDYSDIRIRILGHTDDVGADEDNLQLSQDRADAVKMALVSRDIASSRVVSVGMGEKDPIADNTTDEGRALNRRTEFVIIR
ncbi:MAG: OmpA family protein [Bacteroidota bacterium]